MLGLSPDRLEKIGAVLQREIGAGTLPGALAMVGRAGRVAWTGSFGRLDPRQDDPMREDAIFRIYSMTKPIVTVALMMLVEEGLLQITDPVSRFVPEFADPKVGTVVDGRLVLAAAASEPTVQDLMRHTSGLTYEFIATGPLQKLYVDAKVFQRDADNAELAARLGRLPLAYHPGTRWEYSRATDVLGRVVEVVSGQALGAFLSARIFGPLRMPDTGFWVAPEHQHRIAEPFARDPDTGESVRLLEPRQRQAFESGGGGLMSTLSDYARFVQMLANGGALDGVRLLGKATLDFMTADHLGDIPHDSPLLAPGQGFGLGFAVRTHAGLGPTPGAVGQYTWGGIAGTTFWVDPALSLTAILMVQAPGRRDYLRTLYRNLVYACVTD